MNALSKVDRTAACWLSGDQCGFVISFGDRKDRQGVMGEVEMLSKIIVGSWATLIEISLWLLLVISLVSGWQAGGFFGAIGGLIIGFIVGSMFLGAFIVLDDIRRTVKSIDSKLQK